jgi:hypothetical protein
MRPLLALVLLGVLHVPGTTGAQEPLHIVVEATTLITDEARLRRIGVDGVRVGVPGVGIGVATGSPRGNVRVGTHIGGLEVTAWLDLVRRERAIQRESTQRVVVLSGSTAQVSGQTTIVGPYGHGASGGNILWVEPVALEDGRVRLRVWSSAGDVGAVPFSGVRTEVAIEGSTELVVPSGTPVVIASNRTSLDQTDRGVASRGSSSSTGEAWIVVRARVVAPGEDAFPLPAGIPEEWLRP